MPADAFYERKIVDCGKQPCAIACQDGPPVASAMRRGFPTRGRTLLIQIKSVTFGMNQNAEMQAELGFRRLIAMSQDRRAVLAAFSAMICTLLAPGAMATQTCQGTYVTAAFQPLPQKVTVELDIRQPSARNQGLADKFLDGVRQEGVTVSSHATVVLSVHASLIENPSDQSPSSGARGRLDFFGLLDAASGTAAIAGAA